MAVINHGPLRRFLSTRVVHESADRVVGVDTVGRARVVARLVRAHYAEIVDTTTFFCPHATFLVRNLVDICVFFA